MAIIGARRGKAGRARRRKFPTGWRGTAQTPRATCQRWSEAEGAPRRSGGEWPRAAEQHVLVRAGRGGEAGAGVRRVEGRGTGGGPGARLLRCSRCAQRCEKCRAGRRAAGQSRGSRGPALWRTGRTHRGRPLTPRAGGEGRGAAALRPGARQPPGEARASRGWGASTGKRCYFVCLAPRLRRSVRCPLPGISAVV